MRQAADAGPPGGPRPGDDGAAGGGGSGPPVAVRPLRRWSLTEADLMPRTGEVGGLLLGCRPSALGTLSSMLGLLDSSMIVAPSILLAAGKGANWVHASAGRQRTPGLAAARHQTHGHGCCRGCWALLAGAPSFAERWLALWLCCARAAPAVSGSDHTLVSQRSRPRTTASTATAACLSLHRARACSAPYRTRALKPTSATTQSASISGCVRVFAPAPA